MQGKRAIRVILAVLVVILVLLVGYELHRSLQPFHIAAISEEKAEQLKQGKSAAEIDVSKEVLFNDSRMAYDTETDTIYVTQNNNSGWQGEFRVQPKHAQLYWIKDEAFSNIEESIKEGHEFSFLYITDRGYQEGKLVCTGLPVLTFDKLYSDKLLSEKTEYFGNLSLTTQNETTGVAYERKDSCALVTQKDVSTTPYEREYRIRLLKKEDAAEEWQPDSIKDAKEQMTKNDIRLLAMDKNDDWDLYPLYTDASMVRAKLTLDVWQEIIADTPYASYATQMEYTEVVINGQYMGIYGLMEHPDGASLSLQDTDRVYEDKVAKLVYRNSCVNLDNYIDYSLLMQCMEGVENMNDKKQNVVKTLSEPIDKKHFELYRMPGKLRNLLSEPQVTILEDGELLREVLDRKESEVSVVYDQIATRFHTLRGTALAEQALQEKVAGYIDKLTITGAIKREEALRKQTGVQKDAAQVVERLKTRMKYLDTYYKKHMPEKMLGVQEKAKPFVQEEKQEYRAENLAAGIPTVYVTIDEKKGTIAAMRATKGVNAYGNIDISVPEGYTGEYTAVHQGDYSGVLEYIRCRGQSSFNTDKKSYKIKLSKKTDLFGMGSSKDWVLIANAFDESLLRNKLAYWLADDIGLKDTPMSVYVNVVMNGEKLGCFTLAQQPDVGEGRVEISEPTKDTDPLKAGFMVEIMPEGRAVREENIMAGPYSEIFYHLKYPREIDTQSEYYQGIVSSLLDIDYLLYGQPSYDLKKLEKYIDVDSFIDYFWVQEVFKNTDCMYASSYLYRDNGGKVRVGPVWDFDLSVGAYMADGSERQKGWYARESHIYERLFTNKEFTACAIARYQEIRPEILHMYQKSEEKEITVLEMYTAQMGEAREQNLEMWGITLGWKPIKHLSFIKQDTMKEADEYIISWLTERMEWIDANIENLQITGTTSIPGLMEVEEVAVNENTNGQ